MTVLRLMAGAVSSSIKTPNISREMQEGIGAPYIYRPGIS